MLWLLVIALCAVVIALARQVGLLHLRLGPRGALEIDTEGPPLGEAPEPLTATDLSGARHTIGGAGERRLLLFVSAGCIVCEQVLPALGAVAASSGLVPSVVVELDRDEAGSAFSNRRLGVPVLPAPDAFAAYAVPGTPYAVVLDESGVVTAKGTPNTLEQLEGLADSAAGRKASAKHGSRVG
jgi:methylamine dehydrogenase accessory protein MauD